MNGIFLLEPPEADSAGIAVFLFLLTCIVSFLAYWLTIESRSLQDRFSRRFGEERGSLYFFIFNKAWGFLWFGIVCTLLALVLFPGFHPRDFGLSLPAKGAATSRTILWCALLLPLFVIGTWLGSRGKAAKKADFGRYPEIRMSRWKASTLVIHISMWCTYLLAYELMFRGTLLFSMAGSLGWWPAVGINVVFYSAAHVPKGAGEAIGALVLGFLLCLITLSTGSIIVAFLAHAALALTNGLGAFHFREDMTYISSGKNKKGTDT